MGDFKDMEQHPSYGMMGFYRAQCGNPQPLFGSSIKHNDIIIMRLQTANYQRGLSEDWYYGDKLIAIIENELQILLRKIDNHEIAFDSNTVMKDFEIYKNLRRQLDRKRKKSNRPNA